MNQKIRLTALLLTSAFVCGQAYAARCGGQTSGKCNPGEGCIKGSTGTYGCVSLCGNPNIGFGTNYSATGYCATGTCTNGICK